MYPQLNYNDKAPLPDGCVPRVDWLKGRALELSGAISRYIAEGYYDKGVREWSEELADTLEEIESLKVTL